MALLSVVQALTLGFSDTAGRHSVQLFNSMKVKVKAQSFECYAERVVYLL